jgi:glycosyltransferase involved in cell wall biosynthesis/SAM-dependent methyltransferase
MNYLLVSHSSFSSNSGTQAYYILESLVKMGWDCAISVPHTPESLFEVFGIECLPFKLIKHGTTQLAGLFDDGRGPDVIHALTPRQHVRNETLRLADYFNVPYVVHLEANEKAILRMQVGIENVESLADSPVVYQLDHIADELIWPAYYRSFLKHAIGVTALDACLLESHGVSQTALVFWPGFEPRFLERLNRQESRERFNLPDDQVLLMYGGVVQDLNADAVESLVLAVAELNRRGHQVRLVNVGNDEHPVLTNLPSAVAELVINVGTIERSDLPHLFQAVDALVQPGMASDGDDDSFPFHLPNCFAAGIPVVMPKTHLGLHIVDGVEGILLKAGNYREIADRITPLITDPTLAKQIGDAGRDFARQELTWNKNVTKIHDWLIEILQSQSSEHDSQSHEMVSSYSYEIDTSNTEDPKLIAFYLPQFHPIPENDQWWGEGFTEWTNVKRAEPNFTGHYQPRLPADLGFYDLRDPEVMDNQAAIAQLYGVYGFCFYYYWFNGKRLLERPLETMLANHKPDMPFCLCWANENWTRRWDGLDHEILMEQSYQPGWVDSFFQDILPYFKDERYIRVDGKPMLVLYRIERIPDAEDAIQTWKHLAKGAGFGGLHIVGVQSFGISPELSVDMGADAVVEFPPHLLPAERALIAPPKLPGINQDFEGYVEDYPSFMQHLLSRPPVDIPWYRALMPSWDNTPRRGAKSHIFVNSSPQLYERWLQYLVDYARCAPNGQPLIFVNAWNEWAEGAYLEPDNKYGWQYLEATSRALRGYVPIREVSPYQPIRKPPLKMPPLDDSTDDTEPATAKGSLENTEFFLSTPGQCPICGSASEAQFIARHSWLRDHYKCKDCHSCPRQRSMALLLEQLLPHWRHLSIHEGSPSIPYYAKSGFNYTSSAYFPHIQPGKKDPTTGFRCENFEALTFADNTFDIFMHQDVLEHVFNPHLSVREAMRVLKPGGLHIFTVPKNKLLLTSEPRARLNQGQIEYLKPAEYHGDPKSHQGVLVTWDYGADLDDLLSAFGGYLMSTHIMRDRRHGVDGDYLDVFYSWKTPENQLTYGERVALLRSWPHGEQFLSFL